MRLISLSQLTRISTEAVKINCVTVTCIRIYFPQFTLVQNNRTTTSKRCEKCASINARFYIVYAQTSANSCRSVRSALVNEKSAQRDANTARCLCRRGPSSISVPNLKRIALFVQKLLGGPKFRPAADPFPGARDGQNLISWRWSLPLPINPV